MAAIERAMDQRGIEADMPGGRYFAPDLGRVPRQVPTWVVRERDATEPMHRVEHLFDVIADLGVP